MLTREEVLHVLEDMATDKNKEKIEELTAKIASMSDEEFQDVLQERKIKSIKDVKKVVQKMSKKEKPRRVKFEELNDVVSFGVTGKTLHVHLIPKDARHMLTREGRKQAEVALIDAMEKIKLKMQNEKKYSKIQNVYAVSGIMTGIVARWFKELGFDVKTLPIEQAKEDRELSKFYDRFKDQNKLGRANLQREVLMSEEWETRKDEIKEKLQIGAKQPNFVEQLQTLNSTDGEIVQATDEIKTKCKDKEEVKPEEIE